MNVNYDKELEKIIGGIDRSAPPRLLLHVCCAPCATACLARLAESFDITLYYTNDNITDANEWQKRLDEVYKLTEIINGGRFETQPIRPVGLQVRQHCAERFFQAAQGLEQEREGGARCRQCFMLRLGDAKAYAENNGYDYFGTTLTVSPYKNSALLNETGKLLETDALKWLPSDFKKRNGYGESIRLSAKYGLYRQHYCGCVFSQSIQ